MRSSLVSAVSLIGLSCLSLVSAAPFADRSIRQHDVFPDVPAGSKRLLVIEEKALGSLSNAPPPPTTPKPESLTSLQFLAYNELFEVAFFRSLIHNITNHVPGYHIDHPGARAFILNALVAVEAQEKLHVLNANNALAHFTNKTILPCEYVFPATTFEDAIALANLFTDLVLGTLQDVQNVFATNGDIALIQGVASVIGQEGEQNGFYRQLLDKIPSELPFLTTATREFAFSALQSFIVPGSCPNQTDINLQIFKPLTIVSTTGDPTTNITLSFDASNSDYSSLSLVFINQQNLPVVQPIEGAEMDSSTGIVTFNAVFPYNVTTDGATFGNGLTIGALTNSSGPFATANEVAAATVFGPVLLVSGP